MVMPAPGTSAPEESFTTPRMVPVFCCAEAVTVIRRSIEAATMRALSAPDRFSVLLSITPPLLAGKFFLLADRLLLAECPVAESRTGSGAQGKTSDGAARIFDEFDLIPKQRRHEAGFRLGCERLYLPARAEMQDQQFAIDGDHGLASRCELVSPRVPVEGLRSELKPVPGHQVFGKPLILADRLEQLGVRRQRLVCLKGNRPGKCLRILEGHF